MLLWMHMVWYNIQETTSGRNELLRARRAMSRKESDLGSEASTILTNLFLPEGEKKVPVGDETSDDSKSILDRLRSMGSEQIRREKRRRKSSDRKRKRSMMEDAALNEAFGVMVEPQDAIKPISCLVCFVILCACVVLIVITVYMFYSPRR